MNRNKILITIIAITVIAIMLIIVLNTSNNYNSLMISQDKWNTIKKTRNETNQIKIENIEFNGYKLIVDEKNNSIYYSTINNSPNKYNPDVQYSTNSQKTKIAFLSNQITDEKVKGKVKFDVMIYNEKQYHIYQLICTDLPIININQHSQSEEVYIFDNMTNIPNRVTISDGKIQEKENNYILSLQMLTPGKNKRENARSILNMKPDSEFILKPTEDITQKEKEQNREQRIELFINNEYRGVYTIEPLKEVKKYIK